MVLKFSKPTTTHGGLFVLHRRAALAGFMTLGLVADAAAQPSPSLIIGLRSGPESMDPHWSTLSGRIEALRHVFDRLVAQNEQLNLKPAT
jgi:peptide/nickel transport system substrate-binding protein